MVSTILKVLRRVIAAALLQPSGSSTRLSIALAAAMVHWVKAVTAAVKGAWSISVFFFHLFGWHHDLACPCVRSPKDTLPEQNLKNGKLYNCKALLLCAYYKPLKPLRTHLDIMTLVTKALY